MYNGILDDENFLNIKLLPQLSNFSTLILQAPPVITIAAHQLIISCYPNTIVWFKICEIYSNLSFCATLSLNFQIARLEPEE